jgi:hypothetical protein
VYVTPMSRGGNKADAISEQMNGSSPGSTSSCRTTGPPIGPPELPGAHLSQGLRGKHPGFSGHLRKDRSRDCCAWEFHHR